MRGRRISPAEVVSAFQQTGLLPVAGCYFERTPGDGPDQGCGETAVAIARGLHPVFTLRELTAELGVSQRYLERFAEGWDGAALAGLDPAQDTDVPRGPVSQTAYRDGWAAFEAVVAWRVARALGRRRRDTPRCARQLQWLEVERMRQAVLDTPDVVPQKPLTAILTELAQHPASPVAFHWFEPSLLEELANAQAVDVTPAPATTLPARKAA